MPHLQNAQPNPAALLARHQKALRAKTGLMAALIALGLAIHPAGSAAAHAQTAAPAPSATSPQAGNPALSGVWQASTYTAALKPLDGGAIPFTAAGRQRWAKARQAVAKDAQADPARYLCLPQGPVRALTTAYPLRIFQTDDRFVMLFEENRVYQRIRVGAELHDPADWDPAYMGDAVGHWEGKTFVARIGNLHENVFLDDSLLPTSENTQIEQRYALAADGRSLEVLVTITDKTLYARPWSARLRFEPRPELEVETNEWVCGEPHRDISAVAQLASAPASHPSRGPARPPLATPQPTRALAVTASQRATGGLWSMLAAGLTIPPPPPPSPDGKPPRRPTDSLFPDDLTRLLLPSTLKPYLELREKMAMGENFPTPDNHCLPFMVPATAAWYGPYEILINDDKVLFLFQADHQSRLVAMNTPLPAAPALTFTGTSVGHWDGPDLVVETRGWNDRSMIKQVVRHSDALRATERYHLADDGKHLIVNTVFEDPGAMTGPWQIEIRPARDPEGDFQEYVAGEGLGFYPCPNAANGSPFPRPGKAPSH